MDEEFNAHNPDSTVKRYKAHLVEKGYAYGEGINYKETYSSVVKPINLTSHKCLMFWVSVSWRVSCFFPGIAFLILTTLNFLLWGTYSTGLIPISLFVILILLWFCI
uniref:Uncharacterized protein n=1 Tax=Nelumbo nucifera TaxID=4432 RepID=A0A822Y4R0_NELNU|nr:TPA_asm: hypothetical protein HUJ06_030392 [Nelumbo nucifera]